MPEDSAELLSVQSFIGDLSRQATAKPKPEEVRPTVTFVMPKSPDVPHKNTLILVAAIIALLVASPIQSTVIGYVNNPSFSQTQSLFAVSPNLQSICMNSSTPCTSAVLSFATVLSLAYTYSQTLPIQENPQIAIKNSNVAAGSNVTLVIKPWAGAKASDLTAFMLHVFLVDPEGTVQAESAQGDTVNYVTYVTPPTFQFPSYGNFVNGFSQSFAANGIRYTMTIPNDSFAVGTWRIALFVTGVSPSNPYTISGAKTASFTVSSSSLPSSLAQTSAGLLGIGGSLYTGEKYILSKQRLAGTATDFVRKNWFSILSVIVLAVYVLSIYYPF